MAGLRTIIAGAGGRMGAANLRAVAAHSGMVLVGAVDRPGAAAVGKDAGLLAGLEELGVAVSDDISALLDTADVVINADELAQTYSAAPKTVSATTEPAGLGFVITYNGSETPPVDAGTYTVIAYVNDTNYVGADTAILVVSQATAAVTADLKWIYDYEPLPEFTATFSGFMGSDDVSSVTSLTFTVSPAYTGAAGTYQIIPAATAVNYVFTPVSAPLYVNPNGSGTKQVKPKLVCIEQFTTPDEEGFYYLANWEYGNTNPTDIYIPAGSDNYFSGDAEYNALAQPSLFMSGGGEFSTPFDGEKLIWTVISYKNNGQKGAVASQASSTSGRCNKSEEAEAPVIGREGLSELKVFPNPTNGRVYIELAEGQESVDNITLYDIFGKSEAIKPANTNGSAFEIDLSGFAAGIYFLGVQAGDTFTLTRIIRK